MQHGFTLIELMIVIAIIAILSAIGIPAYQGYLQKAALTDMLQLLQPYKTAIELCALKQGRLDHCDTGSQGIPPARTSRYVASLSVSQGNILLQGAETLSGLTAELLVSYDATQGLLTWKKRCSSTNQTLTENCRAQLRYDDQDNAQ